MSQNGYITYKIPDGAEMTDFMISTRHHYNHQGALTVSLSKDGINWNTYKGTQKWLYATTGHRKVTVPESGMELTEYQYLRVDLLSGDGGGGAATTVSPSLMNTIIMYTYPKYISAAINEQPVSEDEVNLLTVNGSKINLMFSKKPDSDSVSKNIILTENNTKTEAVIEPNGNGVSVLPKNGWNYDTEYTLEIKDGLVTEEGGRFDNLPKLLKFKTNELDFVMRNLKFSGDADSAVSADITNYSGKDAKVTLMILGYSDGLLCTFDYKEVQINAGETLRNVQTGSISTAECDKVTAVLWNDLEKMTALSKPVIK